MAKYPALQDEVEKICMTHIRGAEQNTKEQVCDCVSGRLFFLSDITTKHM